MAQPGDQTQGGMKMRDEQAQRPKFEMPANFTAVVQMFPTVERKPVQELFKTTVAAGATNEAVQAQFEQQFPKAAAKIKETFGSESVGTFVELGISFYNKQAEKAKGFGEPALGAMHSDPKLEAYFAEEHARVEPKGVKARKGNKRGGANSKEKSPAPAEQTLQNYKAAVITFIIANRDKIPLEHGSERDDFVNHMAPKLQQLGVNTKNASNDPRFSNLVVGTYNEWKASRSGEGVQLARK